MQTKHLLGYCGVCEHHMVICITCGNNCCNGTYGEINGQQCVDCPDAYSVHELYRKDPNVVEFAGIGRKIPAVSYRDQ